MVYVTPDGDIQFRTGIPYTITGSPLSANNGISINKQVEKLVEENEALKREISQAVTR